MPCACVCVCVVPGTWAIESRAPFKRSLFDQLLSPNTVCCGVLPSQREKVDTENGVRRISKLDDAKDVTPPYSVRTRSNIAPARENHNLSCHFHLYQQHSSFVLPKRAGTARSWPGPCGCIPLASSLRLARLRRVRERGDGTSERTETWHVRPIIFFTLNCNRVEPQSSQNPIFWSKMNDDDDDDMNSLAHNPPLVR